MSVKISVRRLRRNDWRIVRELFGDNGACGGCWCRYWFLPRGGKLWDEMKGPRNRRAMQRDLEAGTLKGSLAFQGKQCVGWCCYGKTREFPRLRNSKILWRDPPEDSWSIVCFFIPASRRNNGVATALLEHAVKIIAARKRASCIEAYPVSTANYRSRQVPGAFAWTGVPSMFRQAGFKPVKAKSGQRAIYRLQLGN